MLGKLFGRKPIRVWAIQQLDAELLHVVGEGTLDSDLKPKQLRAYLAAEQYSGGVRIRDTGMVLNSRLLAAVLPVEELWLEESRNAALWQGKRWRIAWVPQRSWHYEGQLVAEPDPVRGGKTLVSVEDVSGIRQRAQPATTPGGTVVFRPMGANEDEEQNLRASIEEARRRRQEGEYGWREDGSWEALD